VKASATRVALTALLALASTAHADETAADRKSVYVGLEVSNEETRRLLAGAALRWDGRWDLDAQLARADFDLPEIETSSTMASAHLQYGFGKFAAGIGFRRGAVADVSTTTGWNAGATYSRETLRFGVEIESRNTSLDPAPFTEDLGVGLGIQTGTSRCEVDSRGYQAQVNLDRPRWLGFVSYRIYDYQDFDCLVTVTSGGNGNGPPTHARGRALGRRLGEAALGPVRGFSSRLIPREAMLLDSSAALGVTLPIDAHWIGGAELYRDVERVGDSAVNTALAFASRKLGDTWTMELSLGFSDADDVPDTTFAGVRMSADL